VHKNKSKFAISANFRIENQSQNPVRTAQLRKGVIRLASSAPLGSDRAGDLSVVDCIKAIGECQTDVDAGGLAVSCGPPWGKLNATSPQTIAPPLQTVCQDRNKPHELLHILDVSFLHLLAQPANSHVFDHPLTLRGGLLLLHGSLLSDGGKDPNRRLKRPCHKETHKYGPTSRLAANAAKRLSPPAHGVDRHDRPLAVTQQGAGMLRCGPSFRTFAAGAKSSRQ